MTQTSVARKFIMALTGFLLIAFLLTHLLINTFSLFSAELFNEGAHFMATNPLIQVTQYVLALGFLVHIVMGIKLTLQNKAARPVAYAYNKPGENSSLSSRTMIISGALVLAFIILHLRDYFYELKFVGLPEGTTDYDLVVALFTSPIYTAVYVVSFIVLGFHLNHGFQSAFQSVGANHKKYTPTIQKLGTAYSILIAVGFSAIAICHFINQL